MTDVSPTSKPEPRPLELQIESLNERLLDIPAEMRVTRNLLVEIGVHADKKGVPPLNRIAIAQIKAIRSLEERIVAIEKHLGL